MGGTQSKPSDEGRQREEKERREQREQREQREREQRERREREQREQREQREREQYQREREDFRRDYEREQRERQQYQRDRDEFRKDKEDFRNERDEWRKERDEYKDVQREFRESMGSVNRLLQLMAQQVETVMKARDEQEVKKQTLRANQGGKQPTPEEIEVARKNLGYKEGHFHFAVAGSSGCGKSSLINAARGKGDREKDSAKTGIVETTTKISRYPDQSPFTQGKFVWYDVPGCDTLDSTAEEYFNTQGLYIFDAIIVAVDRQMTASTIAIIKSCISWGIPWYLVRSKADQHIENLVQQFREQENGGNDEDDIDSDDDPKSAKAIERRCKARDQFIEETRIQLGKVLKNIDIGYVEPYIVSSSNLRKSVKKQRQIKGGIHEWKLIQDLVRDVFIRGVVKSGERRMYQDFSTRVKTNEEEGIISDDDDDDSDSSSTIAGDNPNHCQALVPCTGESLPVVPST